MASCSELEDKDDEEDEQIDSLKASPSNTDDKVIVVLEALPACMRLKHIFHFPKVMHEQIVVTVHHAKSHVDKMTDINEHAKLTT